LADYTPYRLALLVSKRVKGESKIPAAEKDGHELWLSNLFGRLWFDYRRRTPKLRRFFHPKILDELRKSTPQFAVLSLQPGSRLVNLSLFVPKDIF
jgi:hypothetical protein